MKPNRQPDIVRRLHCAAGHLNAVIKMAEAGEPCEQVLHQLNAVQSALHAAGGQLICCEAESSRATILNGSSPEKRVAELKRLQSLYSIFMQYSIHHNEVIYD